MVTEMQQHRLKAIIAGSAIVLLLASSIAGAAIADYIMKPAPSETNMQESEEKIRALREAALARSRALYQMDRYQRPALSFEYDPTEVPVEQGRQMLSIPHLLMGEEAWGQALYRYSNAPGGSTMVSSGCGPTALAMILEGYGVYATPLDVANWIADHGGHLAGVGTSGESLMAAARAYGVPMGRVNYGKEDIVAALKNGKAIIAGHGGSFASPLFAAPGGTGHFVVYTGVSDDGSLLYVNDPNDYDDAKHVYNIDTVLAEQPDIYVVL